jgi:hypothetical protein
MEKQDSNTTKKKGNTLSQLNDMTLGQLERIEDYAEMIADRMESGQQLDSWMFSQITVALDNLNAVHDAMDGEDGIEESQVNGKKLGVTPDPKDHMKRREKDEEEVRKLLRDLIYTEMKNLFVKK